MKTIHAYTILALILIFVSFYTLVSFYTFEAYRKVDLQNEEIKIKLIENIRADLFFCGREAIDMVKECEQYGLRQL